MSKNVNRVWRLETRPQGTADENNLKLIEEPLAEPGEGELLLRVVYLSLDPTNRIWMSDMDQYMEPVQIGAPMRGLIAGQVVKSNTSRFSEGELVMGAGHWADYMITDGKGLSSLGKPGAVPLAEIFGMCAVVGPTAYFGLLDICDPKPGETVVVTAAAGGVGSVVGQIAKMKGARAVGIAGSDEKCKWIKDECGYDAAINYKTEDVGAMLDRYCPEGVDVLFENVGGWIMDEILLRMNNFSRMALCGLISQYNAKEPVPGPYNFQQILMHRIKVQGFIASDYAKDYPKAIGELSSWMREGKLKFRLDIDKGLENALTSLNKLYDGSNQGKLMIEVSEVAG